MGAPPRARRRRFDDRYFSDLDAARDHWWVRGMQEIGSALLDASWGGDPPADLRVLDARCGSGNSLDWLSARAGRCPAERGAAPTAIGSCRQRAPSEDVQLALASVTALPLRQEWHDLVVSLDVLQHLPVCQEQHALVEMFRELKPGGLLLMRTNAAFGRSRVAERQDWRMYRPAGPNGQGRPGPGSLQTYDECTTTTCPLLPLREHTLLRRPAHHAYSRSFIDLLRIQHFSFLHDHAHFGSFSYSLPPEFRR